MVDARLPIGVARQRDHPAALPGRAGAHDPPVPASPFTVDELDPLRHGHADMFDFLNACVEARLNCVVSGGTGSGKTTTLNVLSSVHPQ